MDKEKMTGKAPISKEKRKQAEKMQHLAHKYASLFIAEMLVEDFKIHQQVVTSGLLVASCYNAIDELIKDEEKEKFKNHFKDVMESAINMLIFGEEE